MRVLVTGANGFLGKNLIQHMAERGDIEVRTFTRKNKPSQLEEMLEGIDYIFHLAGVNRPNNESEFVDGNVELTRLLCNAIAVSGRLPTIVFASSAQAALDNPYGLSKYEAENLLFALQKNNGIKAHIFRLPNVFGKWCKPDYNSVVATFCHNIARGIPIHINNSSTTMTLVYVDDVIHHFIQLLDGAEGMKDADGFEVLNPQYIITVGELAKQIEVFKKGRCTLISDHVGTGLVRALYSTYMSYLPVEELSYYVPVYKDARGVFVEILKTIDCGQFSYFTANPGITRGGHYHHSKTEKFLVMKGRAKFRFRHVLTDEACEVIADGEKPEIVETIPGWAHDITNIGNEVMIVALWANEVYDLKKPDTYAKSL